MLSEPNAVGAIPPGGTCAGPPTATVLPTGWKLPLPDGARPYICACCGGGNPCCCAGAKPCGGGENPCAGDIPGCMPIGCIPGGRLPRFMIAIAPASNTTPPT